MSQTATSLLRSDFTHTANYCVEVLMVASVLGLINLSFMLESVQGKRGVGRPKKPGKALDKDNPKPSKLTTAEYWSKQLQNDIKDGKYLTRLWYYIAREEDGSYYVGYIHNFRKLPANAGQGKAGTPVWKVKYPDNDEEELTLAEIAEGLALAHSMGKGGQCKATEFK